MKNTKIIKKDSSVLAKEMRKASKLNMKKEDVLQKYEITNREFLFAIKSYYSANVSSGIIKRFNENERLDTEIIQPTSKGLIFLADMSFVYDLPTKQLKELLTSSFVVFPSWFLGELYTMPKDKYELKNKLISAINEADTPVILAKVGKPGDVIESTDKIANIVFTGASLMNVGFEVKILTKSAALAKACIEAGIKKGFFVFEKPLPYNLPAKYFMQTAQAVVEIVPLKSHIADIMENKIKIRKFQSLIFLEDRALEDAVLMLITGKGKIKERKYFNSKGGYQITKGNEILLFRCSGEELIMSVGIVEGEKFKFLRTEKVSAISDFDIIYKDAIESAMKKLHITAETKNSVVSN